MRRRRWLFLPVLCLLCAACGFSGGDGSDVATAPEGWQTYVDDVSGFSISYPADLLSFQQNGTAAVFRHQVPFPHQDPCDFQGDAPQLPSITDFSVSMDVLEKTLRGAILETEGTDYVVSNFMRGGQLRRSPDGSVAPVAFAGLRGHRVTSGIEDCGRHAYYFTTPRGRTLVVLRSFVPELRTAMADEALAVPGVLSPEKEDELFSRMMRTVRFTGEETGSGASK